MARSRPWRQTRATRPATIADSHGEGEREAGAARRQAVPRRSGVGPLHQHRRGDGDRAGRKGGDHGDDAGAGRQVVAGPSRPLTLDGLAGALVSVPAGPAKHSRGDQRDRRLHRDAVVPDRLCPLRADDVPVQLLVGDERVHDVLVAVLEAVLLAARDGLGGIADPQHPVAALVPLGEVGGCTEGLVTPISPSV